MRVKGVGSFGIKVWVRGSGTERFKGFGVRHFRVQVSVSALACNSWAW